MERKQMIEEIVTDFHAMRNKMHGIMAQQGEHREMTLARWCTLSAIEHAPGSLGIKEISDMLGISPSAATQLVDSLVVSNYVVRTTSLEDRRALLLELSPEGKKQMAGTKKKYMQEVAVLFDALSDTEIASYFRLHKKISSHMMKS